MDPPAPVPPVGSALQEDPMTPKPKTLGKVTRLRLTPELHERLKAGGLTTGQGGYQETFRRMLASVRAGNGEAVAIITERELASLREYANRGDAGGWPDWARDALEHNGI